MWTEVSVEAWVVGGCPARSGPLPGGWHSQSHSLDAVSWTVLCSTLSVLSLLDTFYNL